MNDIVTRLAAAFRIAHVRMLHGDVIAAGAAHARNQAETKTPSHDLYLAWQDAYEAYCEAARNAAR